MDYVRLGKSGLKVSPLTLGCMSFGSGGFSGGWSLSETDAEPIFRLALDLGITFWDTANVYGKGTSEEITGRMLARLARRDDIVLATKLFGPMGDGPGGAGLSRKAVMEQIDASLKPKHLEDAVAALGLKLTNEEVAELEAPYTPRLPTYFL